MMNQERARELFNYSPETGVISWSKTSGPRSQKGAEAGWSQAGYRRIQADGEMYMSHRVAWLLAYGDWPFAQIDHIDGNRTNNRLENLREASHLENMKNKKTYTTNKSGVVGVYWAADREKWRARIGGKNLGAHSSIEAAATERREAEITQEYHRNHGRTA